MNPVLSDHDVDHHTHDGPHDHVHSHGDHTQWPSWERAHGGPVVLDIGAGRGALVVTIDNGEVGSELFLRPADGTGPETHVAVWERPLPSGTVITAAVFGSLSQGTYSLSDRSGGVEIARVRVVDGEVAEHRLSGSPRGGAQHARS